MLDKIKRAMFPITLSKGLEVISEIHKGSQTIRWYNAVLQQLIETIGDIQVQKVTTQHIDDWLADVKSRHLSPWTSNSYVRAMKAFFNHMVKIGHLEVSPAAHLKVPKVPRSKPKDISDRDLAELVRVSKINRRDYALICTLRDTGCRVGGLVSMTVDAIHIEQLDNGNRRGKAMVIEKGARPRWVFFGNECAMAIIDYLEVRPQYAPAELWLNYKFDGGLSTQGVYHVLRRYAKMAGVKRFNPHAFRHRLAKKLEAERIPHRAIQEIMGWTSDAMLQMYVAYSVDELQRQYERYQNGDGDS